MSTHFTEGFELRAGPDAHEEPVEPLLPARRTGPLCASCGSPGHQLCARISAGDVLILRIRRPR